MIIIIVEILMVIVMALGAIQPVQMSNGSPAVRFLVAQGQIKVVNRSQLQRQLRRSRLRRQCQQRPYHQSNAERMQMFWNLVLDSLN